MVMFNMKMLIQERVKRLDEPSGRISHTRLSCCYFFFLSFPLITSDDLFFPLIIKVWSKHYSKHESREFILSLIKDLIAIDSFIFTPPSLTRLVTCWILFQRKMRNFSLKIRPLFPSADLLFFVFLFCRHQSSIHLLLGHHETQRNWGHVCHW